MKKRPVQEGIHSVPTLTLLSLSIFSRIPEKKAIERMFFFFFQNQPGFGQLCIDFQGDSFKAICFFFPQWTLLNTAPVKTDTQEEKAKWK